MKHLIQSIILLFLSTGIGFAQLDRSQIPQADKAPQINIDDAQFFELKNGLKVFLVEDHKFPEISYNLFLDYPPFTEGDKTGVSMFAGSLMRAGTSNRSKIEIDESIDFIGGGLATYAGGISASALSKHNKTLLGLMSDVLMNPSFPQEELEKLKKQHISGFAANKEDPAAIAENIEKVLLLGKKHPYGEIMTEETIEAIAVEDLKNFHNTYFRPNMARLVIVGDISLKDAKSAVETYFSKWEKQDAPSQSPSMPQPLSNPMVAVGQKDGANQSLISVSYNIDLKTGADDYIKAMVMNQILGGGSFSARLFQNLREDKAFTYGAYSRLRADDWVGKFSAGASVRTSVTDSAITEIIYEMNRLKTELVSESDLELVKNSMAGNFARSLENPGTVAGFAINIDKYNLPADYYKTYLEKLHAVTPQDVQAMAKKYLTPEHALIMAIGDVAGMKKKVAKFAKDGIVKEFDFYGNEVVTNDTPTDLTANAVIENYIHAIGGKQRLSGVTDMAYEGTSSIQGMLLKVKMYMKSPNKYFSETSVQGQILSKEVYNGEKGIINTPQGIVPMDEQRLKIFQEKTSLFDELQFLENGYKLEIVGTSEEAGEQVVKLKIISPAGEQKNMLYSLSTGLKVGEIINMNGTPVKVSIKDYQEVKGIKIPSHLIQSAFGQQVEILFETIKINEGVSEETFAL